MEAVSLVCIFAQTRASGDILMFRTTSIPLILVKMEIAPFFNATYGYLSFEPSIITLGLLKVGQN